MPSTIEWTDDTWNPFTGCTKVSDGCINCYAAKRAQMMRFNPNPKTAHRYRNGFKPTAQRDIFHKPDHWRKPRRVFVCSMSDFFHPGHSDADRYELLEVMADNPKHTFCLLTKRTMEAQNFFTERVEEFDLAKHHHEPWLQYSEMGLPFNIWLGATVESAKYTDRIDTLRTIKAHTRFLSLEPLLGPLPNLDLTDIHWVIVGGESGPNARWIEPEWVRGIRDQCAEQDVPFFFKQWGGTRKIKGNNILDSIRHEASPVVAE